MIMMRVILRANHFRRASIPPGYTRAMTAHATNPADVSPHLAPTPVTLPRVHWGPTDVPRRALLVHGLGSSGTTMWELGEGLGAAGWSATAVDLRGHGTAPRTSTYRIADFAADLAATRSHDDTWDAVIAHSIGAAAAVVAAAGAPDWTRRLVLLDPALRADEQLRSTILDSQRAAHHGATVAQVAADYPHWHPQTVQLRVSAARSASLFALERAVLDNPDWDVATDSTHVTAPTLIIAGDPAQGGMFAGPHGDEFLAANRHFHSVMISAGHSVHRDAADLVLDHVLDFIDGRARGHS
jgi:pimeloyl-ACP methyl ester carboxylesterase